MRLGTPREWYARDHAPAALTRMLLRPPSWLWAWTTARRLARATPRDAGAPVVCVGNLTMGGAGKTPVVREILRRLRLQGIEAHGLARGHGGRLRGPHRVEATRDTARDVGDEPLMLSADGPFWVARDRAAGAIAAAAAGAQAIVLDDGHQNPSLRKALSLVVVDGETRGDEWPFGDGAVFPAGPMREPLQAGLARADAVVVLLPLDHPAPAPELLALFPPVRVLVARLEAASPPPDGPRLGFAGVGKPWKVERALRAAGCDLVDFAPFPDHATYTRGDLDFLSARADALGARLVTTEKDWMRLPVAWRARVDAWPVRVRFEDEAALDALLARALARRGPVGASATDLV